VNWLKLWEAEVDPEEWCVEPILPRGRQAGLFAVAGTGKSLLAADIAAAKATGRSVLGQPAQTPVHVVYLDLEMTPDDLRDRLTDMGYGMDSDLSRLHYYQLPVLPPMDTAEGGDVLMAIVERDKPELVVIDTMARVVEGYENSADTYRDFYRCTGSRLKSAGVALLRLDHAGKDVTKGQRGSSSKNDDLDVLWSLSTADDQVILTRTKSRVSWVPPRVVLTRRLDPWLRHELDAAGYPAGTKKLIEQMDRLGLPDDASCNVAMVALRESGKGRRKSEVLAAVGFRKLRNQVGNHPGNHPLQTTGNHPGNHPQNSMPKAQVEDVGAILGTTGNHPASHGSRVFPSIEGTTGTDHDLDPEYDLLADVQ